MTISSNSIKEVRLHGRGGQGAFFAATLTAEIVTLSGYYPQAFPFFGAERRGAPVMAFLRYSKNPLMPRNRVYHPNCAVAFDAELPSQLILQGLQKDGPIIINGSGAVLKSWKRLAEGKPLYGIDASNIAADQGLLASGIPIISTIMVGALVRVMELADLHTMLEGMRGKFPQKEESNLIGAERGFREVEEVKNNA